jgi:hypothetical protein
MGRPRKITALDVLRVFVSARRGTDDTALDLLPGHTASDPHRIAAGDPLLAADRHASEAQKASVGGSTWKDS